MIVVSDSTPLITLMKAGKLGILNDKNTARKPRADEVVRG